MAASGTAWQEARQSARKARAHLLAGDDSDADAETVLDAALDAADLRATSLPPRDPLLSGAHAVLDKEAENVWVRADAPPEDRSVLVSHELGHLYLHEHGEACHCSHADVTTLPESTLAVGYGPRQRRETEANVWAREFLLPVPLAHHLFYDERLDAQTIAARIGVPLGLVFAQLMEVASGLVEEKEPEVQSVPVGLDDSQRAAATWEQPTPLLVGAGPGTGKTRTLTARVLFLTGERHVAPENILALTFSRKAAEEMRERIAAQAPDVARRAAISTFHAYGLDLLRRYSHAAHLPSTPILLEAVDACALLERRLGFLGLSALRYLHDPAYPLPDILRAIGRAKEDLIDPDEFATRALASGDEKLQETARVYAAYENLLREKGALDFADLICRALRLLQTNEAVRKAEQVQWKHILVDEYQDVNRAGSLLVQTLASGGESGAAHLWAVGDVRQAIYAFRGASPANVSRFQADFTGGQRVPLAVNYRSRPQLTALFGVACGEGAKTWQASRETAQTTVTLAVAPDETTQIDHIAREIRAFETQGYRLGAQVVLCRTRRQATLLRQSLRDRGIAVAPGPDEGGLLWQRDVKKLLALLSRSAEPNSPALARFPQLPAGLPVKGDAFDFWAELLWGKPGWARDIQDRASIAQLLSLARVFRERAEIVLESREEPRQAFLNHLRRMARLGASFGERADGDDSAETVRVLTVHAAKGLEFPVVYVPNLSAGKFPSRSAPSLLSPLPGDEEAEDADGTTDEEARLFFVALTRARDHLILSRAEKYNKISAKPSPLLACLDGAENVRRVDWEQTKPPCPPAGDVRPIMGGSEVPFTEVGDGSPNAAFSEPPIIGRTSPAGGQGGVSTGNTPLEVEAWQAELYLRCPRRYAYACVENLPTGPPTAYTGFKQAVEAAQNAPDPAAALTKTWDTHGPDKAHPLAALYRAAADEILARPAVPLPPHEETPKLRVERLDGTLLVRPDRSEADNTVLETQTFRRPPKPGEARVSGDARQSLLFEAASQTNPNPKTEPVVHLRYLQTGQVFPGHLHTQKARYPPSGIRPRVVGNSLERFSAHPTGRGRMPYLSLSFPVPGVTARQIWGRNFVGANRTFSYYAEFF